jgi:Zn-dependent M28 family amino/carboxypeptidase
MRSVPHARRWAAGTAGAAGLALVVATTGAPGYADPGPGAKDARKSAKFRAEVTPAVIAEHLAAFQAIADTHEGGRASGTPGYDASVDYVVDRLEAAGYAPTVQPFEFPFFQELGTATFEQVSPTPTTYTTPEDFSTMTYSGTGSAAGTAVPVDTDATPVSQATPSTSGCETADFTGFPAGEVALMQRGSCAFGVKVANAEAAGASAAIVFNSGAEGATDSYTGTLGAPAGIPAIGTSFAIGADLVEAGDAEVKVATDTVSEVRTTYNVHAETERGRARDVVQAGAHLDSVIDGAGINDNGSGSAALLATAEAMADEKPKNRVRFSWWGAEELGLLGSDHYVTDLVANDPRTLERIGLYLNFDMVGSPNYVRFVYDGDNSAYGEAEGAAVGPEGSGAIEKLFTDYFASQGLESEESPFSGRSDYGPFIAEGVPAGGLFTGAEGVKTEEQAAIYGGTAGEAYDPCYHQTCDDLGNVNDDALAEMSGAVAHAVYTYAMDVRSVTAPKKDKPAKATGTGERRKNAHDYDRPHHHDKRR